MFNDPSNASRVGLVSVLAFACTFNKTCLSGQPATYFAFIRQVNKRLTFDTQWTSQGTLWQHLFSHKRLEPV